MSPTCTWLSRRMWQGTVYRPSSRHLWYVNYFYTWFCKAWKYFWQLFNVKQARKYGLLKWTGKHSGILHGNLMNTEYRSECKHLTIDGLIIRIFNGCEVLIENSVTRVTVRHHEACRVMPNSYSSDGIFSLYGRTIMDYFSCILYLWQLHLNLNMCYQFYAKINAFFNQEKYGTAPLLYVDVEMFGGNGCENHVKTSKIMSKLHHSCKTTFPSPGRVHGNPIRVCKNNDFYPEHFHMTACISLTYALVCTCNNI